MSNRLTEIEIEERFKTKKESKEHDFFDICNQIKLIMDAGLKSLKDSELNGGGKDETDDKELDIYLKDLNDRVERINDKFIRGLGQMYKGVLVQGELSVRENGGVYAYRCQYKMNSEQVARLLIAHKEKVIGNMGDEKSKIIFEIIDKLYHKEEHKEGNEGNIDVLDVLIGVLNIDTSIATGEQQIKPFHVFDFERRSYADDTYVNKGDMRYINKMSYNRGRIVFSDENGSSIGNSIIHRLCLDKYQDVITEIRNKIINELQSKKDKLQKAEDIVDNLLGKYLIAAELSA